VTHRDAEEDDLSDTVVPRLIAAGANLKRVHFVKSVISGPLLLLIVGSLLLLITLVTA
jgi:hypothetical protein